LNKSIDEELGRRVGVAGKEKADVVVGVERREEGAHVGSENSKQRHAPQNIDKDNAFGKVDGADPLRF
jgi:hypothetical protein